MADRIDEMKGRIKEGAGKVTGDEELEAKGKDEAETARAGRKIKGAIREAGGAVKEAIGKIAGDEKTEAEGKADRLSGKIQQSG